jgi:Tfp pilus assembly protein PilV
MEVLASMFVICIGLLGVLAVIPYGAYQTAKAKNAENTSWILDAAEKDIIAIKMVKPTSWIAEGNTLQFLDTSTSTTVNIFVNDVSDSNKELNCSRFLMIDPFSNNIIVNNHIYRIGTNSNFMPSQLQVFRTKMIGQDDLVYTTHSDKRTDFSGQDNKILSSGQYTWFFMFQPLPRSSYTGTLPMVLWSNVENYTDIDILGCYNRVPGTEQVLSPISASLYYNNSILLTIPSGDYDLKNTKYVFLSWDHTSKPRADGGWYKIIYVAETQNSQLDIFLTLHGGTPYPSVGSTNLQMLIVPGVMYHKRIENAKIK